MPHRLLILVFLLTLALSSAGRAQDASPPTSEPTALAAMLARVPADLPELDNSEHVTIAYTNIAAQLDAVGVAVPEHLGDAGFDQWAAATSALPLPGHATQFLPFWREDYGFDLLQADQVLWVSLPPYDLTLYRGRFDERGILDALTKLGYEPIDVGGQTIMSIRGDYEPDLQAPTAYVFAAMNYAAILADGTLVFASAQAPLAAVLGVAADERPSLADRHGVAPLLSQLPPDLAGALLVHGTMLAGGDPAAILQVEPGATPDLGAIATEMDERGEMPPVVMALLGITAGGPVDSPGEAGALPSDAPDARAVAVLLMHDPATAETAAAVVTARLATGASTWTGEPFAAVFPDRSVQAVPGSPVLVIDLTLGAEIPPNILMQLLVRRDLGFLAW